MTVRGVGRIVGEGTMGAILKPPRSVKSKASKYKSKINIKMTFTPCATARAYISISILIPCVCLFFFFSPRNRKLQTARKCNRTVHR